MARRPTKAGGKMPDHKYGRGDSTARGAGELYYGKHGAYGVPGLPVDIPASEPMGGHGGRATAGEKPGTPGLGGDIGVPPYSRAGKGSVKKLMAYAKCRKYKR